MNTCPNCGQKLSRKQSEWTPFAVHEGKHRVVQTDLSRWDYKHQVLESTHVPNWRVVFWVKLIEAICQLRPKSLFRLLAHPDPLLRAGMRWYSNIGRRVWVHEVWQWLFFDRRTRHGPMLVEFLKGGWHRDWNSQQSGSVAGTEPVPIRPKSPLSETPQPWPVASASLSSLAVNHSNVSPLTPGVEAARS